MAIELQCPGCSGRLMVETPGVVVACPHCGMHLQAPAAPVPEASDPAVAPPMPTLEEALLVPHSATEDATINIEPAEIEWPTIEESPAEPWLPPDEEAAGQEVPEFLATLDDVDAGDISDGATMQLTEPVAEHPEPEAVSGADATMVELPAPFPPPTGTSPAPDFSSIAETIGDAGVPATAAGFDKTEMLPEMPQHFTEQFTKSEPLAEAKTEAFAAPVMPVAPDNPEERHEEEETEKTRRAPRPSKPLNKLLANYALLMTLICAYLAYRVLNSSSGLNPLDLPDLAPPRDVKGRKTTLRFVAPETVMPRAYSLTLGESQQYGSLRVTPVRVTRGPLEFVHYDPASKIAKEPVGPVLKLHLKIENVSEDQEFPPLDRELVFRREPDDKHPELLLSNNWVCRESEKKRSGKRVLVYDLPIGSPWNLKDQSLDHDLKPGETLETYIPTTAESVESLSGPLVWRIHFRKGYNPRSFRGVTTVVEVVFDSSQIEAEAETS